MPYAYLQRGNAQMMAKSSLLQAHCALSRCRTHRPLQQSEALLEAEAGGGGAASRLAAAAERKGAREGPKPRTGAGTADAGATAGEATLWRPCTNTEDVRGARGSLGPSKAVDHSPISAGVRGRCALKRRRRCTAAASTQGMSDMSLAQRQQEQHLDSKNALMHI